MLAEPGRVEQARQALVTDICTECGCDLTPQEAGRCMVCQRYHEGEG